VINVANLMDSPHSIGWGGSIYAKVTATNDYGTSDDSDVSTGALIYTKPDPPTALTEVSASRT